MMLYHVTTPESVISILKDGLLANEDGEIFVLTDEKFAAYVAKFQLFLDVFSVIGIDEAGINGNVEPDTVAELTAHCQRIIKQNLIAPKFLNLIAEEEEVGEFFFREE